MEGTNLQTISFARIVFGVNFCDIYQRRRMKMMRNFVEHRDSYSMLL